MKKLFIISIALLFSLIACFPETENYLDDILPSPQDNTQELAFGMSTFGFDLYDELADATGQDDNIVFSPYSISSCLGMVYAGAAGQTAVQIADVLNYTLDDDTLHQTFGNLSADLIAQNNIDASELMDEEDYELTLKINNGGWLQQNYGIIDTYTDILKDHYDALVSFVDYVADYDTIDDEINSWTDNATNGKIPQLISENMINAATRLVLVNTIYLKGSWQYPFDKDLTEDQPFYTLDGSPVTVPMMVQTESFGYAEDGQLQAVSLPLIRSSLGLVIILPKKGKFNTVEQDISTDGLYGIVQAMERTKVSCTIPRFKVRTKRKLNDDLKALGMTDAFSGNADFSGMTGGPNSLFISFVVHEAIIEVQEKGLEAAAATAVVMIEGAYPDPSGPVDFIANRPFLYAVYDHQSDAVLFLGRVMVPEE